MAKIGILKPDRKQEFENFVDYNFFCIDFSLLGDLIYWSIILLDKKLPYKYRNYSTADFLIAFFPEILHFE